MTTLAIEIVGTKLAAALIDKNLRFSQRREL
ncbi:N-acetylmannosamine kinase, partial [Salmonella enterica subsp. enterica serovar Infantis]